MERNRYRNVLPYDYNRVLLHNVERKEENNYINASHLYLPFSRRHYILAQGPLSGTSVDFWQMILENRTRVIVCLTKMVEKSFIK